MKLFALLITFLVGFAAATPKINWESGKEYRFAYSGRLLNGLPELSNQFTGIGINATVALYVQGREFAVKVQDAKYVAVNDQLQVQEGSSNYDEGNNWRKLRLPEMQPIPQQSAKCLEEPISFRLGENGAAEQIKVEQHSPMWCVNFKKALINLFQAKMQSEGQIENMIESPVKRPYWTVKEQNIIGQCEASYQMNELPEYLIRENPALIPNKDACQGQEYFEIVRTINFDKCDRFASFQKFGTGSFTKCSADSMTNCGNFWGRTSSIKYFACGSRSSGKINVQTILNDGEMSTILLGHQTETFVTGTRQNLTLSEVRPSSGIPHVNQPVTLDGLLYDFTDAKTENIEGSDLSQKSITEGRIPKGAQTPYTVSKANPFTSLSGLEGNQKPSRSAIGDRIVDILDEMTKDIHGSAGGRISESQLGMKLLTAARGFSMFETAEEIEGVFGRLQGSNDDHKYSQRQLFLDACAIAGTPPAVEFFTKMLQNPQAGITESELTHYLLWLPHNVLAPKQETLKGLFNVITSGYVKSKPQIYRVGITSLAQLVQQACVSQQRDYMYPSQVFGEFCKPESSIVQEVLIPYLSKEARNTGASETHRNVHIVALGLISHKNVIGELTPLIGETEGQQQQTRGLRRILALYSLAKVGGANPNLVIPIFQSLFTNPSECTEVRIIAFNSLLRLNPPSHVFNTIVHTTRQEPSMDYELLKTINIALYTLGHSDITLGMPQRQVELIQKSKDAYAVVKKTYGIAPSSGSYYKTEFLKDFGTGYQGYFHWISSQESIIPKNVFAKVNLFMQTCEMNVFELGYRLHGAESLYEKVADALNGHSGQSESLREQIRQGLSSEWKNVMEKLQLKTREPSKVEGAFYARAFGSGIFLSSFSESTSKAIQQKIVEMIRNPSLSSVNGESKINVQKSFVFNPYVMLIPSEMGFPIDMEIYQPTTLSFYGKMNLNAEKSNPSVSVDGKVLVSTQLTGWVGTINPFDSEYVLTGQDHHILYNVPGSLRLDLNIPEQKVSVTLRPGAGKRSGETDVAHFHVMPYTVREKIAALIPHTKSQNMKVIRSSTPPKSGEYRFGENLGLSMKAQYKTESVFADMRSTMETLRMYNYSPFNMALFQWMVPAFDGQMRVSTRQQRYTLTINPSESSTQEITAEFKIGYASKQHGKGTQYHSIKPVSGSERLSSQESVEGVAPSITSLVKKILPYRVHSESLQSSSKHQNRAQKLQQTVEGLGEVQSAQGVCINTRIVLKGNRPRTLGYTLTVAGGQQPKESRRVEQKWNVHVETTHQSESSVPKKICIEGKLDLPLLPMWNINSLRTSLSQFYYQNKIAFGQSQCSESTIYTKGVSRVSEKQRNHALETPEFKMCQKLSQQQVEGSQLSQVCQKARDQLSALDEVEFTTEYTRVPQYVQEAERKTVAVLKAFLWPYYSFKASSVHGSEPSRQTSFQTKTLIGFHQRTPSFDLTLHRPHETVIFSNVHIYQPYSLFFPLKASMSGMSFVRKVTGGAIYPSCKVDGNTVTSYDNKTIAFQPDKCFHLLTADCSRFHRFGVSVRSVEGGRKELKVFLRKTVVVLTPAGNEGPRITVNGQPLEVPVNRETSIYFEGSSGKQLATVHRSIDGVVTLRAPSVYLSELSTNGRLISVVPSPMLKNKLCGLCGDNNQEKNADIAGPQKCIYSKPELKVASYRIPSDSCPPLPTPVKQELRKETEQCSKYQIRPSKVASGYKINTGKCTILRHIIMQQQSKICISKVPVTQCGPSCKSMSSDLVEKTVPFVCLPPGRLADNYIRKVHQGKPVEELKSMETAFESKMNQPRHCVHALVSGSTPSF